MCAMPYVPATNVIQTEFVYTYDSQVCENVIHFQNTGAITTPIFNALGVYLVNWYNTNMKPLMPATVSLNALKMTDLTTQTSGFLNYSTGLPIIGTLADFALPNNVALVITKRTVNRGRSFRGRIYHMGLTEGKVTNNAVLGAFVTSLLTAYGLLLAFTPSVGSMQMVVVSKVSAGVARGSAVVSQVTGLDTDGSVDSQRRRLPRRTA